MEIGPVENHDISLLLYIHNIVKMFFPFKAKTFYKILINYFGYVLNFVLKWGKIGVFYSAFRALAHVIEAEMMPQYSADRPSCRPAAAAAPEGLILS